MVIHCVEIAVFNGRFCSENSLDLRNLATLTASLRDCCMDHPKVTRLFKYAPFNSRSISALVTGKFWLPLPFTFNDPFDCTIPNHSLELLRRREIGFEKTQKAELRKGRKNTKNEDLGSAIRRIHRNALTRVTKRDVDIAQKFVDGHNSLQSYFYTFGVLSLSETPKNILMWSHYGAQHSGICFELERNPDNKLGKDAKPVTYSGSRSVKRSQTALGNENPAFSKYAGWRYEREWRLLENKGGKLHDFPGELLSVICGARMQPQDIDTVERIVESLNKSRGKQILVKVAKMNEKTYAIHILQHGR